MKATGYNSKISWISMVAIAVIGFLISLPMRLLGLFFVIILDTYNVDREEALIPIVTYGTIRTLSGPIVGYLGQVWGLQVIVLIGCFLSSVGIGLSCFTEDIVSLTICLGLVYGAGFSLSNNLITSVIRQHFTEYLSLTTGILITASSLGSTIMTPVIHYLKNLYGTSGMFLILSGIFLHTIPAAIFLRNPKNEEREHQKNLPTKQIINNNQTIKLVDSEILNSVSNEENIKEIILQVTPTKNCENVTSEKEFRFSNKGENGYVNETFENKSEILDLNKSNIHIENCGISFISSAPEEKQKTSANPSKIELLKYSKIDADIINSLTLIKQYNKTNSKKSVNKLCEPQDSESVLKIKNSKALCHSIRLLYDPSFLLQMIIQSAHAFGYTLILSIIIDYARDKQISTEDALYFITFMPITQIFGSLGFNWITDGQYMTRANFCAICFSILSIDIGYLIWSYNFTLLKIGYLVYGCVNGALLSIFPGMIMDSIEREQQNMALASRFTLYGLLCPLKSPIVGYFREDLQSYDGIYFIIMGLSIFCAILAKVTPILESCRERSDNKMLEKSG